MAKAIWSIAGFELSTISRVRTRRPDLAAGVTVLVVSEMEPSDGFVPSTCAAVTEVELVNTGTVNGVALSIVPRDASWTSGRPRVSSVTYRSGR